MRIALFSDVHGNLTALRAVFAALDQHRPLQMIVAAGDHVLAGPRPAERWMRSHIAQYRVSYHAETEAAAMTASTIPKSVPGWSPPAKQNQ